MTDTNTSELKRSASNPLPATPPPAKLSRPRQIRKISTIPKEATVRQNLLDWEYFGVHSLELGKGDAQK
eukprot:3793263-Rhodomonas_salina.1